MAFVLIPAFPIEPILFGLGARPRPFRRPRVAEGPPVRLAVAAGGLAAAAGVFVIRPERVVAPTADGIVVLRKETAYHRLLVVDQGTRAASSTSTTSRRACIDRLDGRPPRPTSTPTASRRRSSGGATPARNAFVIGLGTGMLPRFFSEKAPEIATTSVEIDPEVVRVAGEYFGFRADANDRVLVGDGRSVLEREKGPWDAIFLDAYFSDSVPFHLTTLEFFQLCRDRLSPDGVFAANIVGTMMGRDQRLFWAIVRIGAAGLSRPSPSSRPSSPPAARGSGQRHPRRLHLPRPPLEGPRLRGGRPPRGRDGPPPDRALGPLRTTRAR